MTMRLEAQWIVGFVDGEGCFHLDVHMNQTCYWKIQIQPEFTVVQGEVDVQVLYAMKKYFGCGSVGVNRKDKTSTRMMYRVKNIDDLNNKILPFFEKHQLKTKKNVEFQRFRQIVRKMKEDYHKANLKQFLEIIKLGEDLRVRSGTWKGYRSEKLAAQIQFLQELLSEECKKDPNYD
jgi:hypothetical protein